VNIEFHPEVLKELQRLPRPVFGAALQAIIGLAREPRPTGIKKLVGSQNDWRVRIGEYRIIYEISEADDRITILRVAHRREAYRS
jgi:mRNA interferase RelE/StbE